MGIHDTNSEQVVMERLASAQRKILHLLDLLKKINEAIDCHMVEYGGQAFPLSQCNEMMEKALEVYTEIAKCNGAALVRGTVEEKIKISGSEFSKVLFGKTLNGSLVK